MVSIYYLYNHPILSDIIYENDSKKLRDFLQANEVSTVVLNLCLLSAAQNDVLNAEIVLELLKSGANPNICDKNGETPLSLICIRSENIDAISHLIDFGMILNTKDNESGNSPLHNVSTIGNIEIMKILLEHGADPNAINNEKKTSLHCLANNPEKIDGSTISKAIRLLSKYPVDINAQDEDGYTPIYSAVYEQNIEAIQSLAEIGANWNIRADCRFSPLESTLYSNVVGSLKFEMLAIMKCVFLYQHLGY